MDSDTVDVGQLADRLLALRLCGRAEPGACDGHLGPEQVLVCWREERPEVAVHHLDVGEQLVAREVEVLGNLAPPEVDEVERGIRCRVDFAVAQRLSGGEVRHVVRCGAKRGVGVTRGRCAVEAHSQTAEIGEVIDAPVAHEEIAKADDRVTERHDRNGASFDVHRHRVRHWRPEGPDALVVIEAAVEVRQVAEPELGDVVLNRMTRRHLKIAVDHRRGECVVG